MAYATTLGALCIGSMIAMFLSGLLATQVYVYYKGYKGDIFRVKFIVGLLWLLDLTHTAMICEANWYYLVANFANVDVPKLIAWSVCATIALTAITTFVVHCFFTQRVYTLSKQNLYITIPIAIFAFLRVVSAYGLACTVQMARLKTWARFHQDSPWLFTTGLSISAALDFVLATALIVFLQRSRTGWRSMDHIINTISLYTIETGLLTSIVALVSLICWITMSDNLIFIALYFIISKLYSNSLLATLNARKQLLLRSHQSSNQEGHVLSVRLPSVRQRFKDHSHSDQIDTKLEISVEKTIHQVADQEDSLPGQTQYDNSTSAERDGDNGSIIKVF